MSAGGGEREAEQLLRQFVVGGQVHGGDEVRRILGGVSREDEGSG